MEADYINKFVDKEGRMNQRALFALLDSSKKNSLDESVLKPSAQSTKQCDDDKDKDEAYSVVKHRGNELKAMSQEIYSIVVALEVTGCRISELINIKVYDINKNGQFKIKGLKGSADRLFTILEIRDYLIMCRINRCDPFGTFSRFYYYRLFKKMGIGTVYGNSTKASVTHSFRHEYIVNLNELDSSNELVKSNVGHKNIKNTEYYAKGKKK